MTQEKKELLLRDLSARLPYGVKVLCLRDFNHTWYTLEMIDIGDNEVYLTTNESYANRYVEIEDVKPYLFPLSSMTEEQKEELNKVTNGKFYANNTYINNCKPRNWSEWGTTEYNWITHSDIDLLHTWLNQNHFDYRGLIPMDLANDATGLNIY